MKFFNTQDVDFRLVFETGPSLCLLLKPDAPQFTVLAASDAYLAEANVTRETIIRKSFFEIYQGPAAAKLGSALQKVLAQKTPLNIQLTNFQLGFKQFDPTPDEGVWNISLVPVTDSRSGQISYISMRAEIASQLESIKKLGDNLPEGAIYQIVEEPNGALYFSYISAGVSRLLGVTVQEITEDAQNMYNLILPEDLELMKQKDMESLRDMSPFECQIRMRSRDGTIKWVECRSAPRKLADGTIIADGILTDVSERKEAEARLQRALEEAHAANTAKSDFLTNMSHEIRTPMNAVVGISNLLSTAQLSQEKQKDLLETLQNSADNLLGLINDMLDFAKIEDGKVHFEEIEFNLNELVEKSLSVIRIKAQEKGIHLKVQFDPDLAPTYIGDPLRVQQILMNLLSNAVKFTQIGTIEVHVRANSIDRMNQNVVIEVIDTGIGIARDKQAAIFDKFAQAETSTARVYGGSGLGLAICKALAEHMNGSISVKSEEGKGSVFTVTLQLKANPALNLIAESGNESAQAESDAPSRGAILLVEDHYPNILVATTLLEELGYRYDVAKTGHEAIEKFSNDRWDVILMDLSMPGMDGFETSHIIRKLEGERDHGEKTPIIAMTAHAMEGIRQDCLKAGMNDYIAKPYSATELMTKLEQFIKSAAN